MIVLSSLNIVNRIYEMSGQGAPKPGQPNEFILSSFHGMTFANVTVKLPVWVRSTDPGNGTESSAVPSLLLQDFDEAVDVNAAALACNQVLSFSNARIRFQVWEQPTAAPGNDAEDTPHHEEGVYSSQRIEATPDLPEASENPLREGDPRAGSRSIPQPSGEEEDPRLSEEQYDIRPQPTQRRTASPPAKRTKRIA